MRRLALVTGAAQGLGRAIAQRLADAETAVIVADIQYDRALRTAGEMKASGFEVSAVRVDVADEKSVAAAYAQVARQHGRLDILVNNAGVSGINEGRREGVEEMSLASWERTLKVNLSGTFLMCRSAIPLMRAGRFGRIVNMSSRSGRGRSGLRNSSYAASKSAMIGMSRVLAGEVGRDGITVNCIAPSRVVTEMTLAATGGKEDYFKAAVDESAVGRLGVPEDVADAVAFLCSDDAAFITGAVLDVNGGSFMP